MRRVSQPIALHGVDPSWIATRPLVMTRSADLLFPTEEGHVLAGEPSSAESLLTRGTAHSIHVEDAGASIDTVS